MTELTHATPAAVERVEPTRIHPLVADLVARNPDVATLEKIMILQREWEADEARKAYASALVDLQRDLPSVISHDKVVDFPAKGGRTHYTHATLAHVVEQVEKPLARHGFARSFGGSNQPDKVSVTCFLKHRGGHQESLTIAAPPDTSGSKNAIQAIGSTITYLRRYTLLSLLGIATADMPDADEAQEATPEEAANVVDASLNLQAAAWLQKHGKPITEAQAHVGRSVQEWTRADLDKLRAWAAPPPPAEPLQGEAAPVAASARPPAALAPPPAKGVSRAYAQMQNIALNAGLDAASVAAIKKAVMGTRSRADLTDADVAAFERAVNLKLNEDAG